MNKLILTVFIATLLILPTTTHAKPSTCRDRLASNLAYVAENMVEQSYPPDNIRDYDYQDRKIIILKFVYYDGTYSVVAVVKGKVVAAMEGEQLVVLDENTRWMCYVDRLVKKDSK